MLSEGYPVWEAVTPCFASATQPALAIAERLRALVWLDHWVGASRSGTRRCAAAIFGWVILLRAGRAGCGDHPLRPIRAIVDAALGAPESETLYAPIGRPSIPPRGCCGAAAGLPFGSERQLREQLGYKLLFGWFVGLGVDDPIGDATVCTKKPQAAPGGRVHGRDARSAALRAARAAHRGLPQPASQCATAPS